LARYSNPSKRNSPLIAQPGALRQHALTRAVAWSKNSICKSGRIVIIAAGISTYGTQAAEFLTEPSRLEELARRAPLPLSRGSFQVLLSTKVIGNTPTPARVVDTHFW
jgi:hypothetical protein